MMNDADFEATLHRSADASGAVIMPYFRSSLAIENKKTTHFDPVTEADREAEKAIRKVIAESYPDDGIIGEEFGSVRPNARVQWIIDPIDGTRAFVQGLPTWGTLIGIIQDGNPLAGMMNQPFTGERYWSDGSRAYYQGPDGNKTQLSTRKADLATAQMSTTDPWLFAEDLEARSFERLRQAVRTCRYGTDCYAYCLLAAGHIDIVLEAGLQAYDIAPLIPIIECAGGVVTTWDGGSAANGGRILACGDSRLHSEIVAFWASA